MNFEVSSFACSHFQLVLFSTGSFANRFHFYGAKINIITKIFSFNKRPCLLSLSHGTNFSRVEKIVAGVGQKRGSGIRVTKTFSWFSIFPLFSLWSFARTGSEDRIQRTEQTENQRTKFLTIGPKLYILGTITQHVFFFLNVWP